jgi:predicted phosphohydrolase
MRLGFTTDIHLDCLPDVIQTSKEANTLARGYQGIQDIGRKLAEGHDALVIAGDISQGPSLKEHLAVFCTAEKIPVYFVLGNHDFWDIQEAEVRSAASKFPGYLDEAGIIELTPVTALVGRSGWYDTLSGNPFTSKIRVQDFHRTERLVNTWRTPHLLQAECRRWATEEAEKARPILEAAAERYANVIFTTHFPCFTTACWDESGHLDNGISGWWPWSIDTTMGRMIYEVISRHPRVQFTMLTGHTHGGGRATLRPNLLCISGRAVYGSPRLAETFTL